MQLTGLDQLLWAAGFGLHLVLLAILILRRRYRQFPLFTALIAANVLRTVVLFFLRARLSALTYFYVFWSLGVVDTLLQFAVVYEIAMQVFRPVGAWARDVRGPLIVIGAVCVALAGGLAWLASPPTRFPVQGIVLKGTFFVAVILTELFLGIIVLSVRAGLPWRTHAARIGQGLGLYSLFDIVLEAVHNYYGVPADAGLYTALSHLRMAIYLACVLFWIVTIEREEPAPLRLPFALSNRLSVLRRSTAMTREQMRGRAGR